MIETFTTKINSTELNAHEVINQTELPKEDKAFYETLKEPLESLLIQPSTTSVHAILTYAKQFPSSSL